MNSNMKVFRKKAKEEFDNEIKKIEHAEKSFKDYTFFNSLAIMFFVMSLIIVIISCVFKTNLMYFNESLVSVVLMTFIGLSIVSLLISSFYNQKTIKLVKNYYNN